MAGTCVGEKEGKPRRRPLVTPKNKEAALRERRHSQTLGKDNTTISRGTPRVNNSSPRVVTVDFADTGDSGENKFRRIIAECRLSHNEKKQIEFVSLEGFDLTISLPYEWQGRTETLYTLRDRILVAANSLNIDIRLIPTVFREGSLQIPDMPEAALDGWLGNLCRERLRAFPRAYAWPVLVAAASVLVPNMGSRRTNVYVALVGDKGTGKSAVRDYCFKLLGIKGEQVIDAMAGSAEGLFTEGLDVGGKAKIFSPDELSHTLAKAAIDRASLPYVLSRAYYDTAFHLIISKQKHLPFNCRLSIVGGIVESNFDQSFNH